MVNLLNKFETPDYSQGTVIDLVDISDLRSKVTDTESGRYKLLPLEVWLSEGEDKLRQLMHEDGIYVLPNLELIQWLESFIDKDKTIEIGSGTGYICQFLGIKGTDNKMQSWKDISFWYQLNGQPTIQYPDHVEKLGGVFAAKTYKPDTVIGCYVTHKYNPKQHSLGGNQYGVDYNDLYKHCKRIILIGNHKVHDQNPFTKTNRHIKIENPSFLYTRSQRDLNCIYVWDKLNRELL